MTQRGETSEEDRRGVEALLNGYRASALMAAAVKLGLFDCLAGRPMTGAELAEAVGAHSGAIGRALRGLAVLGLCEEQADGRFAATARGRLLARATPGSLRDSALLIGEEYLPTWGALEHALRDGAPAFDRVIGMSPWQHRAERPDINDSFNAWLGGVTAGVARAVLEAFDFSSFRTIVDVGGGRGALLCAILRRHSGVRGVLFDLAHVTAAFDEPGLAGRCVVAPGDFFADDLPPADLYLLKSVLHDWDDAQCLRLLRNCRRTIADGARLLIVERLLPARARDDGATIMLDLHMLAVTGGRERSRDEYRALLEQAGFRLERVVATKSPSMLLEATPVSPA